MRSRYRVVKPPETIDEILARATEGNESPQGDEIPADWPRFSVGDLVPWKGWFFRVEYVDVEEQRVVIKPHRPTKSTLERRVGKKKRKKVRGGRR